MGLRNIMERAAHENRKFFITNCIKFDTPRLAEETYPEDVKVESDIPYAEACNEAGAFADEKYELCCCDRVLDIYTPVNAKEGEMFLLIHGGAFVYGCKELDKNFAMHLSKASGVAVANVGYRLIPHADLQGLLQDIFLALSYVIKNKGVRKIHTIGDSAGGYLSILTAILINSKEARKECGLAQFDEILAGGAVQEGVRAVTANPICTSFRHHPKRFCGIFFDADKKMPAYIYDLTKAITKYGCPPLVLTTGDKDDMRKENEFLLKSVQKAGIPVKYDCAVSTDDRPMHHVYQIAHPTWPESQKVIAMICENVAEA